MTNKNNIKNKLSFYVRSDRLHKVDSLQLNPEFTKRISKFLNLIIDMDFAYFNKYPCYTPSICETSKNLIYIHVHVDKPFKSRDLLSCRIASIENKISIKVLFNNDMTEEMKTLIRKKMEE